MSECQILSKRSSEQRRQHFTRSQSKIETRTEPAVLKGPARAQGSSDPGSARLGDVNDLISEGLHRRVAAAASSLLKYRQPKDVSTGSVCTIWYPNTKRVHWGFTGSKTSSRNPLSDRSDWGYTKIARNLKTVVIPSHSAVLYCHSMSTTTFILPPYNHVNSTRNGTLMTDVLTLTTFIIIMLSH